MRISDWSSDVCSSDLQRFDLKRIPAERLAEHFAGIVAQENVEAEAEALGLVARAAEGSVRDGLSILDQAIAHGHGVVTAAQVREMLGLSDRSAIRALFALVLARSEERRVGKEWVSTSLSRWPAYDLQK